MKERNCSLDMVCGLLVINMILLHTYSAVNISDTFICSIQNRAICFFMPWFFFKSGMYYTITPSTKNLVKNCAVKYLKPFVFYAILGEVIWIIKDLILGNECNLKTFVVDVLHIPYKGSLPGNAPLWFLLTLFFVRILVNLLNKFVREKYLLIIFLILSSSFYLLMSTYQYIPWWVGNTCLGCFFFLCGSILKNIQYRDSILVISLLLYFMLIFFYPSVVGFWNCSVIYGNWFIWILIALSGVILSNNIFKRYQLLHVKWILNVGRNSMSYYCFHWILLVIMNMLFELYRCEDSMIQLTFDIFALLIILPAYTYLVDYVKRINIQKQINENEVY